MIQCLYLKAQGESETRKEVHVCYKGPSLGYHDKRRNESRGTKETSNDLLGGCIAVRRTIWLTIYLLRGYFLLSSRLSTQGVQDLLYPRRRRFKDWVDTLLNSPPDLTDLFVQRVLGSEDSRDVVDCSGEVGRDVVERRVELSGKRGG